MKFYLTICFILFSFVLSAQFYDNFSDGDFSSNPKWFMSDMKAEIEKIGDDFTVKLKATSDAPSNGCFGSFRTASPILDNIWWGCKLGLNTENSNRGSIRFYVAAQLPRLEECTAYFLEINLESLSISFNYSDKTGEHTLIKSKDNIIPKKEIIFLCKIVHIGKEWAIRCSDNNLLLWESETNHNAKFDPTSCGFMIKDDDCSGIICNLYEVNCGDKPTFEEQIKTGEIVFSEIMAKPSPIVELPNQEWVEIYNNSGRELELEGCRLSSRSKTGTLSKYIINPGEYAILCSYGAMLEMMNYTENICVVNSMPSIINDGDILTLRNSMNQIVAYVDYSEEWFGNELFKADGGWSLERKDTQNPINDITNWSASCDPKGGTPGEENSNIETVLDYKSPRIISYGIYNSKSIQVTFNKPMLGETSELYNKIELWGNDLVSISWEEPQKEKLNIYLKENLDSNKTTDITFSDFECINHMIMNDTTISIALPYKAKYMDVIFNEIMFNTTEENSKFVELYNNSDFYIDLCKLMLANKDQANNLINAHKIANESVILPPHKYVVISDDTAKINCLLGINEEAIYIENRIPSLNSIKGNVILTDRGGIFVDALEYSVNWHHPSINDTHNVSLERINAFGMTQDSLNWHSAASSVNYQTAGWENSQTLQIQYQEDKSIFWIEEPCFTPNNDGMNDLLGINYCLPSNGWVMTAKAYTKDGAFVDKIADNVILEQSGKWLWDGTNNYGHTIQTGLYVIVIEVIHPNKGKIQKKLIAIKGW